MLPVRVLRRIGLFLVGLRLVLALLVIDARRHRAAERRGQAGRRFAVLGTMLELGERSLELHSSVAERARQLGLDGLVVVDDGAEGRLMEQAAAGLPRLARVATPEAAALVLAEWLEPEDVVLLKASRGVALERAIAVLQTRLSAAAAASSP